MPLVLIVPLEGSLRKADYGRVMGMPHVSAILFDEYLICKWVTKGLAC